MTILFSAIINSDPAQLQLVNSYVLDPAHIAPSRSDATSNGHFPINSSMMTSGTPRGFNLANMSQMNTFGPFNPGFAGFPNFGNHPVQVPPGWVGGMQAVGGEDGGMHQGGPMRRGGRMQNNRFNPYGRGGRPPNPGRLSPRGAGNMMKGPIGVGFAGDGAQGARGIGPTEATVGRTMKSYQDLDAVGGGGAGGELNY